MVKQRLQKQNFSKYNNYYLWYLMTVHVRKAEAQINLLYVNLEFRFEFFCEKKFVFTSLFTQ